MANRRRGEVPLDLAGTRYTLCLTLGALAELEAACGAGDLAGLAGRFSGGRLRAADLIALLGAALRGGGHDLDDGAVSGLPLAGGLGAVTDALGAVLVEAFGTGEEAQAPPMQDLDSQDLDSRDLDSRDPDGRSPPAPR